MTNGLRCHANMKWLDGGGGGWIVGTTQILQRGSQRSERIARSQSLQEPSSCWCVGGGVWSVVGVTEQTAQQQPTTKTGKTNNESENELLTLVEALFGTTSTLLEFRIQWWRWYFTHITNDKKLNLMEMRNRMDVASVFDDDFVYGAPKRVNSPIGAPTYQL